MIKPITTPAATSVDVVFPGKDEVTIIKKHHKKKFNEITIKTLKHKKLWYDVKSMRTFDGDTTKTFTDINLSTVSNRTRINKTNATILTQN